MVIGRRGTSLICDQCLLRLPASCDGFLLGRKNVRFSTKSPRLPQGNGAEATALEEGVSGGEEQGGMSRRLSQMTEESIEGGGSSMKKMVEDAGFSEELKRKLERRIQDTTFRNENPAAFAELEMPSTAGEGTRAVAAAQPWSGTEKLEDSALRMLDDAHKPLRGSRPLKTPAPRAAPISLDMRMKKAVQRSDGQRLSAARERTSVYALSQDPTLSEKERENMRKILKERFSAGARSMPGSVQGLAALANERIEDAIARGQFKNISRGKGKNVERDYNANSPFLDTTEYFMNKIIQKQEIVPPWIEKQQELVKAAAVFRGRLRSDWKRHAARSIASKGGSLDAQVQRAEAYAVAETANNPKVTKRESMTEINDEGKLSQLTIIETSSPSSDPLASNITVSEDLASASPASADAQSLSENPKQPPPNVDSSSSTKSSDTKSPLPTVRPFRDPTWQSTEQAYHTLAIQSLNNLTRTYNLQAPSLAKKPYFSLDRELRSCFADVAPQLPNEIRERAKRPEKVRVEVVGHRPGGVLERFSTDRVNVYDSRKPNYGFKDFWRDLWG